MKIGFKSDIGKKRKTNEDSFYINEKLCLFIVADGMGGCQGGEVASRMAVETVSEYMLARETLPSDLEDVYNIIMGAIYKANEDIRLKAENDTDLEGMGTHYLKSMITQALGTSDYLAPEIGVFETKKNDYLLLCTDGLTDMLEDQEICSTVIEYN